MLVNPKIKLMLAEIAENSTKLANQRDERKRYQRKLLRMFKDNMSEDEQLYVFNSLLEQINYKSVIVDPDNLITIGNIKMRSHFLIFVMAMVSLVTASYLFGTSSEVNKVVDVVNKLLTILGIK